MKTKDHFKINRECCMNCKHSYYLCLGIGYASMTSVWNKCPDNPTVYYCNEDGTCPLKTQEEFSDYDKNTEWDPNSPVAAWLNFDDEDDPTSSERYVGSGLGICDKYEPMNTAEEEKFNIKVNWN